MNLRDLTADELDYYDDQYDRYSLRTVEMFENQAYKAGYYDAIEYLKKSTAGLAWEKLKNLPDKPTT